MAIQRRTFLKDIGIVSAVPLIRPYISLAPKKRILLIGSGWWGMNILHEAIAFGNCEVVGLCDVDEKHLIEAKEKVEKLISDRPKTFSNYEEAIRVCKPDIAIIGTPDHWHALPAIAAMKAGAHVYLEKPIGHTIGEGQAILKTARDTDRKVQVGTHRRVSPHNISAMEFLRSGAVGDISQVKCFVYYGQGEGTFQNTQEPPSHLDWNAYIGPAKWQEYAANIHPRGFRNFTNFANGTIGDWGIHWFDQVLWWTEEKFPTSIYSTGGRFTKTDNTDAPDTQIATYQFESFTMTWEHRLCSPAKEMGHNVGCMFYGTKGTLHLGWLDGWTFYPKNKNQEVIKVDAHLHDPDHQNIKELWADFIHAIDNNRLPVCDIEKGHLATNISLLGMISYNTRRSITWDGTTEMIINDPEAHSMLRREYREGYEYPS